MNQNAEKIIAVFGTCTTGALSFGLTIASRVVNDPTLLTYGIIAAAVAIGFATRWSRLSGSDGRRGFWLGWTLAALAMLRMIEPPHDLWSAALAGAGFAVFVAAAVLHLRALGRQGPAVTTQASSPRHG